MATPLEQQVDTLGGAGATAAVHGPPGPESHRRWRRSAGVESLGQVQGSGLNTAAYLVRRADGQVVQVSELIHLVLVTLTGERTSAQAADVVSKAFGRRLTADGLDHLVTTKLQPVGLVSDADAPPPAKPAPRARPLLALRLKVTLLPARVVRRLAALLSATFWPPVVVLAVAGLVVMDVALFRRTDALAALAATLVTPSMLVTLYVLVAAGILVHELGHATACHYGGASPGAIGAGVYLVFPAFYTDVTDSYRLDRTGRLRTDLGGLYFNVWGLLAAGTGYLLGGPEVLVIYVLLTHFQMVQQLVPTLRFDGYYVLADLAGVPDLFSRVGPVMRGLLPGRPVHPRVAELRPRSRRIVTAWVVTVVPTLAIGLGWLLWNLRAIVTVAVDAAAVHVATAAAAVTDRAPLALLGALFALAVILLPAVGTVLVLQRLLMLLTRPLRRATARSGPRRSRDGAVARHATTRRSTMLDQSGPISPSTTRPVPTRQPSAATPATAPPPAAASPPATALPPAPAHDGQQPWTGWRLITNPRATAQAASRPRVVPARAPVPPPPAEPATGPALPAPPIAAPTSPPVVDASAAAPEPTAPAAALEPTAPSAASSAAVDAPLPPPPEPPRASARTAPGEHMPGAEEPVPLTAAAFTDEAMFSTGRDTATLGWQHALHVLTGGRISPRPGAAELRYRAMLDQVRTPIVGSRRVVVMSRKGGVGKTTLTLTLGSTFAVERGDRVIAVDANPDAGNLAHRLARGGTRPNARTITDVLGDLERIRTYADLQGYTSQAPESRLEVLASDDDPRITLALTRASYHRVLSLLDAFYNLIVLDTGTGILDSANQGLIADADQLVLVLKPALDGARAAALTLDWLEQHGHGELVESAVVVINGVRRGVGVPLDKVEAHFTKRCAHVTTVPWDEVLEKGAQTDVAQLRRQTRHALQQVAAAVAGNFVEARGSR